MADLGQQLQGHQRGDLKGEEGRSKTRAKGTNGSALAL